LELITGNDSFHLIHDLYMCVMFERYEKYAHSTKHMNYDAAVVGWTM